MTNGRYYTNVNVNVKPNFASTYFNINKADAQENYGISPGGDVLGKENNGHKFYSKSFRCVYSGSWHAFDTWNSTEYSTWNSTGDGAKFRAAQAALGYK